MIAPIIIFIIALVIYSVYSAIFFYHLNEFGYVGDACRPMKGVYTVISLIIIVTTIALLLIAGGVNA